MFNLSFIFTGWAPFVNLVIKENTNWMLMREILNVAITSGLFLNMADVDPT